MCASVNAHVKIGEQLSRADSLFLLDGFQGMSLVCQVWLQVLLTNTSSPHTPILTFFLEYI